MRYIEDLVIHFATGQIRVGNFDDRISRSLGDQCLEGKAFTPKQADIALRLLKKYRAQFQKFGINDIEDIIASPTYKYPLRIIDQQKAVLIDHKEKRFVLKFPYNQQLVTTLRGLNQKNKLTKADWDPDNKHWTLDLNELSLEFIIDNLLGNQFEISEELEQHVNAYQAIRENFEEYVPTLIKFDNTYFFRNIKTDFTSTDLLTALVESAKLGVHVFDDEVNKDVAEYVTHNRLAKIYTHNDYQKFFIDKSKYARQDVLRLVHDMNVDTAIFLDENTSAESLQKWVSDLEAVGVDLKDVGVFFRRKNDSGGIEFNTAIKNLGLNKDGDSKPKWVFLSSKYPKSLLKHAHTVDVCLFENRYVNSHYSIINTVKNSIFTLQYNEHKIAGEDIVDL
jgi:hypothetical protein